MDQRREGRQHHGGIEIMDLTLGGRTALITGASTGHRARHRRSAGAGGLRLDLRVTHGGRLGGRTSGDRRQSQRQCRHPCARSFRQILRSRSSVAAHSDIDILVNNAGAIPGGRLSEIDDTRWRQSWDLKVFGYINMTRAFYEAMKSSQTRGHRQHPGAWRASGWRPPISRDRPATPG